MTPGFSKYIWCHVYTFLNLQITRHQATHKVGYQTGEYIYVCFNLLQGFVWVCMGLDYLLYLGYIIRKKRSMCSGLVEFTLQDVSIIISEPQL